MSEAIAITQVKVFDGNALTEERTVVIENGVISAATTDESTIEAGRRADLQLIDGDPTQDIAATRAIRGVWVTEVKVR